MSALGRTLSEADGERLVPACPAWRVKDVYAHQAGAASDLLAGRLEGAGTDEWTAAQVADRRDVPLSELLDEWDAAAPLLVEALTPFGDEIDHRLLLDLWHHHQDVRGAVGLPGQTTGELTEWVLAQTNALATHLASKADLEVVFAPPPAEPVPGTLTVEPFELARGVLGRRSAAQIRAWSWGVDDPSPVADRLPVFGPRDEPLEETTA
jgi:uncharacterized protein (TIGR03083 family)